MERYVRNHAATFMAVSPIEVMVQGSPLDGYTLILRDETRRGLAKGMIDALAMPMTIAELHAAVAETGATVDELEEYLGELQASGAIIRTEHTGGVDADMVAFNRFGVVPIPRGAHPLIFVGGRIASAISNHMSEYGHRASHLPMTDLKALAPYASTERRETAGDDDESDGRPRLVVIPDVTSISDLRAFNERAVAARAPVLYLAADGVRFAVGPFVDPGRTACYWEYERLHARTLENYSLGSAHAEANGNTIRGSAPRVTVDALAAAATPFLVELALRGTTSLAGQVVRGRSTTAETSRHSVMRLPRCPVCTQTRRHA